MVGGRKVRIEESVAFLCTNNEQLAFEIKSTMPFHWYQKGKRKRKEKKKERNV